jgi:hypothetical protein
MGAEAVHELLKTMDLKAEVVKVREDIPNTSSETKIKRLSKRLKLIESFIELGQPPRVDGAYRAAGAAAGPAPAGAAWTAAGSRPRI